MPKYPQHKVWLNGKIVPPEEAKVSVFSQAVLRGGSVLRLVGPVSAAVSSYELY